jgi:hypothetical protein
MDGSLEKQPGLWRRGSFNFFGSNWWWLNLLETEVWMEKKAPLHGLITEGSHV